MNDHDFRQEDLYFSSLSLCSRRFFLSINTSSSQYVCKTETFDHNQMEYTMKDNEKENIEWIATNVTNCLSSSLRFLQTLTKLT